jgi:RNA polymerase sigma-70 factor (ECF subfamily)
MSNDSTTQIQRLLDGIQLGDDASRDALIRHSCERLKRLTRKMLKGYPRLRRWEQTDDVLQNAILRLHRSLAKVRPKSVADFFALATTQIRRSLIDLARHDYGPEGDAAHHETDHADDEGQRGILAQTVDGQAEPTSLSQWTDFHEQVERLPDKERAVFNLRWYGGLSQQEAAGVLGIDVRTVRRHWQSACIILYEAMDGQCPE